MANLIIKSSADNLVLQGSDASPAITVGATGTTTFAESATLANATITAGTISSAVALNHNAAKYSWHRYANATTNQSSNGDLDFNSSVHTGSGLSESGGVITVDSNGGGLYLVTTRIANNDTEENDHDWYIRVNGSNVYGTRMYIEYKSGGDGDPAFMAGQCSAFVIVGNSQTISIYGNGHYWGHASASMTFFSGCRIGASE